MECPAPAPTGQGQPFQATVQRARRAPRAPPARAPRPLPAQSPARRRPRARTPLPPGASVSASPCARPACGGSCASLVPACASASAPLSRRPPLARGQALRRGALRYQSGRFDWLPTARGRACHRGEGEWPIERSWPSPRRGGRAPAPARDCNGRAGGIQPVPPCVQATNCSSPPTSNPSTCIRSAVRIGTPR